MASPSARAIRLEAETFSRLATELTQRGTQLTGSVHAVRQAASYSGLPGSVADARRAATDVAGLAASLTAWGAALRVRAELTRLAGTADMPGLLLRLRQMEAQDPRGAFRAFAMQMAGDTMQEVVVGLSPDFLRLVAANGLVGQAMRVQLEQTMKAAAAMMADDVFGVMAGTQVRIMVGPFLKADAMARGAAGGAADIMDAKGGLVFGTVLAAGIQIASDRDQGLSRGDVLGRAAVAGGGALAGGLACIAIGLGSFGVGGVACAVGVGLVTGMTADAINARYMPTEAERAAAKAREEFRLHAENMTKLQLFQETYATESDRLAMLKHMARQEVYVRPSGDNAIVVSVTYTRPDGTRFAVQEVDRGSNKVLWTTFFDASGRNVAR